MVDDDPDLAGAVTDLLRMHGYRAEAASNGERALDKVREAMPDLIILDMKMPVMDGWQFAGELGRRFDHAAPIVVFTAAADAQARAAEIHAAGWLDKPFDIHDLLAAVSRQIGQAEGG